MEFFAQNNNRVLYIETPVHLLGLDVLPKDTGRFFRFLRGPRSVAHNIHVGTLPILLPFFQMSSVINSVNSAIIASVLRNWINRLGFQTPLLWIYTPSSAELVEKLPNSGVVYECVDEFRAAKGFVFSSVIGSMEDKLLKLANVCIVTQESLYRRRAAICSNTFVVPNGADTDLFRSIANDDSPPSSIIDRIPRPRLGFVGHIQYWVDLKLLRYLADQRPNWHIVLIGPTHPLADQSHLRGAQNIHLLGRQDQAEIPRMVKGLDVCLNPYKDDEVALNASPLKLYEYLAAGKPVVSTDMPEARKFDGHISIAKTHSDFLACCERLLASLPETPSTIKARLEEAALHSWTKRFMAVNAALESLSLVNNRPH